MLDLLAALIEELFGVGKQPPARPRRRVRPNGDASVREERTQQPAGAWFEQPTTPVAGGNHPDYEKMVRDFFGIQEEDEPPAPEPEDMPAPVAVMTEPMTVMEEPAIVPLAGTLPRRSIAVPEEPAPVWARESAPSLRETAHRLRNNPDAAREGFLYSEIFGPPLADRQ